MGTDLEVVLEYLKELKDQGDYWFTCMGAEYPLWNDKIKALEEFLRAVNEEQE